MAEGDTWINAVIGGIITLVGSGFIPFVPILGGAVAGYLEGGDREDGLRVGAYAGIVAMVPIVLLMLLAVTVFSAMGPGMFVPGMTDVGFGAGFSIAILLLVLVIGLVYIVGFSALGGWVGNYVKQDTDIGS